MSRAFTLSALCLSLIGAGCGGAPSPSSTTPSPQASGLVLRAAEGAGRVSLSLEGLSSCDLKLLKASEGRQTEDVPSAELKVTALSFVLSEQDLSEPPSGLDLESLIRGLSRGGHSVSLRLSPAQRERIERQPERRELILEELRWRLSARLQQLGWSRLRPLPRIWRASSALAGSAVDLSPQEWIAHRPTAQLNLSAHHAESSEGSRAALSLSQRLRELTETIELSGGVIELPASTRCELVEELPSLIKVLSQRELKPSPLELLFDEMSAQIEQPRLILSERPAISEGCAQLFGVTGDSRPEELRPRWSLVIGERRSPSTAATPEDPKLITLPLPHQPKGSSAIPSWRGTPALKALWSRRGLWWGAQRCLALIPASAARAPVPSIEATLSSSASSERLRALPLRLSRAQGVALLPPAHQLLQEEARLKIPIQLRGLAQELWPERVFYDELDSLVGLGALYEPGDEAPSAITLISARPLRLYRSLAHYTAAPGFRALAYAQLSFAGPLITLPSLKGWRAPLSIQTRGEPELLLLPSELKRQTTARAWAFMGRLPPTLQGSLSELKSVYGGRARLKRALKLKRTELRRTRSGELWSVDGGRLGAHRVRLIAPPGERGLQGDERGW